MKDLLQIVRDWKSALFLVVMPILFTIFFGLVFSPDSLALEGDPRLPVGFVDQDQEGNLGSSLQELLETSDVIRPIPLEARDVTKEDVMMVGDNELAALIVPDGYSQRALAGEEPYLTLVAEPSTAAGQTAHSSFETAVSRLRSAVEITHIAGLRGSVFWTGSLAFQV